MLAEPERRANLMSVEEEVVVVEPGVPFVVRPDFSVHPPEGFFLYPPAATVPFAMEGTLGGKIMFITDTFFPRNLARPLGEFSFWKEQLDAIGWKYTSENFDPVRQVADLVGANCPMDVAVKLGYTVPGTHSKYRLRMIAQNGEFMDEKPRWSRGRTVPNEVLQTYYYKNWHALGEEVKSDIHLPPDADRIARGLQFIFEEVERVELKLPRPESEKPKKRFASLCTIFARDNSFPDF